MATQQDVVITARVPGQRLGWLKRELDAAGLPYQVERVGDGYHVHTLEAATPTITKVVNHKPKRGKVNYMPKDVRIIGFVASLILVFVVWAGSAKAEPLAAAAGFDPNIMRGAAILVVGIVVTLAMSELALRDERRGLFIVAMCGLFLAVAAWYFGMGAGLPMGEAWARIVAKVMQ